jgi:hypothetical protein
LFTLTGTSTKVELMGVGQFAKLALVATRTCEATLDQKW